MRFVTIVKDMIMPESTLRLPVFLFDKQSKQRIVAFYAGVEIEEDKFEEVITKVDKGGILQIAYDDITLFCEDVKCNKAQIIQENEFLFEMIEKEETFNDEYSELANSSIQLKTFFAKEEVSFIDLIKQVQAEVMCFPLTCSDEVSLTIQLAHELFARDIIPVRCATIAYTLAKLNKVEDPVTLSSVILAGLFKDLGLNQIQRDAAISEDESMDNMYLKHPMLTIYVLSKASVDFSLLTKRLILEHHEQESGEGFPRGKKEDSIHFLSHCVQASHAITSLVEGGFNNQKYDWNKAFDILINEREIPGLNTSFPRHVRDLIETLKS